MILPRFRKDWPAEWLELWAERAAVMEYCSNMSRPEAEYRADQDTRNTAARALIPQEATK